MFMVVDLLNWKYSLLSPGYCMCKKCGMFWINCRYLHFQTHIKLKLEKVALEVYQPFCSKVLWKFTRTFWEIRLKYLGLLCKKCLLGEMLCEIKNYPFLCTCCTIFPGTLKLIIEQISFEKIVLKNRLSGKFIFLSLPLVKKKTKDSSLMEEIPFHFILTLCLC